MRFLQGKQSMFICFCSCPDELCPQKYRTWDGTTMYDTTRDLKRVGVEQFLVVLDCDKMFEARAKATLCPYSYVLFLSVVCLSVDKLRVTQFDPET